MNELFLISVGSGLRDSINPCIFMTCAVFIIHGLGQGTGLGRTVWSRFIFCLSYMVGTLIFNFGPAQVLVFQKNFVFAAKFIYFVLGISAFVLGILFFKDWSLIRRGLPATEKTRTLPVGAFAAGLTAAVLAIGSSALTTLWPINNYIMLLGNETILRGQWQSVIMLLVGYVSSTMWPLWLVWAFLSIKNLRPSLLKIVCASIFFTASSCVVFLIK